MRFASFTFASNFTVHVSIWPFIITDINSFQLCFDFVHWQWVDRSVGWLVGLSFSIARKCMYAYGFDDVCFMPIFWQTFNDFLFRMFLCLLMGNFAHLARICVLVYVCLFAWVALKMQLSRFSRKNRKKD